LCILQWIQSKDEFQKVMQQTGEEAPIRPNRTERKYKNLSGEIDEELYDRDLSIYKRLKPINGAKQREYLNQVFDGFQERFYDTWLNRHLPEKAPQGDKIKPNEYLNRYCRGKYNS
jgi:hypothetical protein